MCAVLSPAVVWKTTGGKCLCVSVGRESAGADGGTCGAGGRDGGPSQTGLQSHSYIRSMTGAIAETKTVITDQCRYTSELKPFLSVVGVLYGGRQVQNALQFRSTIGAPVLWDADLIL